MNSERMKGAELIFLLDLLYVQRGEKRGEEQRVGVKPAKLFSLCFFYPFGCCSLRLASSRNLFFFPKLRQSYLGEPVDSKPLEGRR